MVSPSGFTAICVVHVTVIGSVANEAPTVRIRLTPVGSTTVVTALGTTTALCTTSQAGEELATQMA